MPEYIDREALLKDISESVVFTVRKGQPSLEIRGANKVIDRIKSAPTADVVEVVRCKDCKFWNSEEEIGYCNSTFGLDDVTSPTDFCSNGMKKEGKE